MSKKKEEEEEEDKKGNLVKIKKKKKNSKALAPTPNKRLIRREEEGEEHLDQHGRIIHNDTVVFSTDWGELVFIHKTIRELLTENLNNKNKLLPVDEVDPIITLMEMLADQEKRVKEKKILILPVNYFLGLWHTLRFCKSIGLYSAKKYRTRLDRVAMKVAEYLDNYHAVKSHEENREKMDVSPEKYYSLPENKLPRAKLTVVKDNKAKKD